MIYVTEGHESGIGLEIFLKSFLLLSAEEKKNITLVTSKEDLDRNLKDLSLNASLFKKLQIVENKKLTGFSSSDSLLSALEIAGAKDILVTLPTSKDQLVLNGEHKAGYTEFFRAYFKNSNLPMSFISPSQNVLLVSDHIRLSDVPNKISAELIESKLSMTLSGFKNFFYVLDEVILAGLNPHAGENGILGDEEKEIYSAIEKLKGSFGDIFRGPYSGDTLHHYVDHSKKQLFVYMYHDQGLAAFKAQYGLVGLNVTFGLPFLRLSVDHGTAFELYGKNRANISGMLYLFKTCFEVERVINK